MASVSVLYIDDEIVGPHLELLRNVCEPESTSRPHVTVRYFEVLPIPKDHLNIKIRHIDLIEPGSFGLNDAEQRANRTVYIRCQSDDLQPHEHKPHYPGSEFHITLYDGKSVDFAKSLLGVLRKVRWGFRVLLPDRTTLSKIEIKSRRLNRARKPREYSVALKRLFQDVTGEHLSWPYLAEMSDERRLELASDICAHLSRATAGFERVELGRGPRANILPAAGEDNGANPDVHLTPPELACEIADYAVSLLDPSDFPVHFGDPAVGTGAFYSALLQVLPPEKIGSAVGVDISAQQVASAQWRWSHKGMKVRLGDYLHMERLSPRTLILANPPYLRHQGIQPAEYKQQLRERASVKSGRRVDARSGLYVYFLLLSHAWMRPGALAAWLVPSEFMQTNYGDAVRQYLTSQVELIRIHQFGHDDPQFENALVMPAVVVFRNCPPPTGQKTHISSGGSLQNPLKNEWVPLERLRHAHKWSIPWLQAKTSAPSELRMRDLFDVRRGIATGANDFFVIKREHAAALGLPEVALRPVLPKARLLETDVIESEADGYPRLRPQLCLLDCDLPEDEIAYQHPNLMEYLMRAKDLHILERNLVRNRHPWYRQERREPAPFLCTYMGRGRAGLPPIRFIWNKSDAVVTNTYLMLYPRAWLAERLRARDGAAAELFALLRETAWGVINDSLRVHAGGLRKIEPGELLGVRLSSSPMWLLGEADSRPPSRTDLD